ncbi:ribosomal protein S12 methylthiotransferase [Megasphaera cerevisiae DSM 20462]|uniref:Ribosomal protein uS12 methylthiotransferase RimO n=1 Tax=Megasphaera cerevisiae DSM 20462 TaxID=1122219 RepID=A0A0J6WXY3_9FIRM|nr:30S ribosomal protein S12 methylthiotransferase RimO [Megasphaera cerevisiae]KMO86712.1 ribosomal protein S12 methylthiotransferase [Megasphaera cerevisiae DSM 20462]OKY53309.1 ribosomal protein S12 methylthiotransferase RimO [Megasphaera cerevisiae]SJZ85930.1 ribosomal protein S12 methylthiotransferase [Megasphaera cerevisiae DSM 20462]
MEKIGFVSLGCSKNLIDTEVMLGILRDRHMEITEDLSAADIIIVNTCTFIEKAKQESINTILQAARYKAEGRCGMLIVTGCLSQQYKEDLMKEMPEIDALLGTGSWDRVWEAIGTVRKGRKACFMDNVSHLYDQKTSRLRMTPAYSAYVKIAEGCNNGCTFCIIPQVRGRLYSRSVPSVAEEVRMLAADGVQEINLIAQDTTSYGVDTAGRPLLPELLRELVRIDGIRWIRLFYLYPHYFTDELMDLIVTEDKICPYVDLPLQHISQTVLRRMNRRDTKEDILNLVKKLCAHGRKLTLRSTFIVGFPGETDEEFQELCDFVEAVKFDDVGVFTYSREEGTAAAQMSEQIPEEVKEERYHTLMAIQAKVSEQRNQELEGSLHTFLVEKITEEDGVRQAAGRIEVQAPEVDGLTYLEDAGSLQPGDMVPVRIAQGFAYDLVAELAE